MSQCEGLTLEGSRKEVKKGSTFSSMIHRKAMKDL